VSRESSARTGAQSRLVCSELSALTLLASRQSRMIGFASAQARSGPAPAWAAVICTVPVKWRPSNALDSVHAACQRAVAYDNPRYRSIRTILEKPQTRSHRVSKEVGR
jgi:hypothetical protein